MTGWTGCYAGYWTNYKYMGRMPDGKWRTFGSPEEYWEAYDYEVLKKGLSK